MQGIKGSFANDMPKKKDFSKKVFRLALKESKNWQERMSYGDVSHSTAQWYLNDLSP